MSRLPLVKICEGCGLQYRRPTGSSRISDDRWSKRRHCSTECGVQAGEGYSDRLNPGAPATHDPLRRNAEVASATLLKRQLGFYDAVARERGLGSVWEAAIQLGMAA
ncbi:hypothetical protein [Sphingomonas sp.]|uniref:hypothetical protein n=1 Tax=Sphingomonas sp. TaxID=28214 RepID=UPI003B3BC194